MKIFLALLALCIVQVLSQSPSCEQKAKDLATLINGWTGNLDGLKAAIKAKMMEEPKGDKKGLSPDEIAKFFDEICKQFKSTLWTCDDFKKWPMDEWTKA